MPLIFRKTTLRGLPARVVSFMANYHSPRTGAIICNSGHKVMYTALNYLRSHGFRYDVLWLDMLEKGSLADLQIKEELGEKTKYREMEGERSPYLNIEGTWEDYLKKCKKGFRKNLKHSLNYLNDPHYELCRYQGGSAQALTDDVINISKRTWKYTQGTGMAGTPELIRYYRSLIQMLAANGWLRLTVLKYKAIPIAFSFTSVYKNRMYGHQIGYDQSYKDISPGQITSGSVIKSAFDNGNTEYDFLGKDEAYKMEFTATCRRHSKYYLFNDTLMGNVLHTLENIIIPGAKTIFGSYTRGNYDNQNPRDARIGN